ncbi:hypothetical protein MMH89_01205 [Candidatus Comchoanobacter bicostacola]|uniref:NAD-dependent epimerase/dehydratase domain-containing protein n=1 Tax=Candidatus Comchoanobacter bicostacola TaxID=2919598 RepID=A0ABY5DKH5_9GAMM|nr:hypothetical protein [Candidatus Comchoanobacter bicostacola]UTC24771.1 hypothetical protein MMH89_01205 [Candidatus Comchoanobacter bicostacola]
MHRILILGFDQFAQHLSITLCNKGAKIYTLNDLPIEHPNAHCIDKDLFTLTPNDIPFITHVLYMVKPWCKKVRHYRRSYIHGLSHILSLISEKRSKPQIILMSSTDIYKQSNISCVDEKTPINTPYWVANILAKAEHQVAQSQLNSLILRIAPTYESVYENTKNKLTANQLNFSSRPNPIHWVSMEDASHAIYHLVAQKHSGIFNINTQPIMINTYLSWMSSYYGISIKATPKIKPWATCPKVSCAKLIATGFNFKGTSQITILA